MNNCCNNVYPDEDLNRWSVTPSTIIADADNYYTKHQIDEMLEDIEASGTCECDLSEIEEELNELSGELDKKLDASAYTPTDLSDYALKSEIPTSNSALTNDAGYLTEHQPIKTINNISLVGTGNIEIGTGGTVDLSNYYNKQEVDAIASGKAETSVVTAHTSNTAIHVSSNEKYNWNTAYNNYFDKNNIFCGTEAEFNAATSGGTNINPNVIYFIHQ
ncbi:MAG: hypothetical protein J6Y78_01800 [Paludibacteraceae bacterium]|nr:hypothetical protein [Paludibacteraceae bacterium]